MKVLISGAGIAGPTLAYWLLRYGFEPTIVERAPSLRTGGYIVDFWGVGFEVAARMGLVDEIKARGYDVQEVRVVDAEGKQIAGFPTDVFARVTQGHFASLPRGALAEAIYKTIDSKVENHF
jgi:2-polyprenyl-6-methoxyphenol hydroxylase-like FAD-dependent oxidoreductase